MIAHRPGNLRHPFVIRCQRPALAIRAEVFAGIETEGGGLAEAADSPAPIPRPVRLTRIFDHHQSAPPGDVQNCFEIDRASIQMHRHDRFGSGGDRSLDLFWIDVGRGGIDIDKDRFRTRVGDRLRGGDERVGRGDDFVTGLHARGQQAKVQRAGAAVERHAVLRFAVGGEFLLKLGDLLAEDERRVAANPVERGEYLLAQFAILGFQIEIGNVHVAGLLRSAVFTLFAGRCPPGTSTGMATTGSRVTIRFHSRVRFAGNGRTKLDVERSRARAATQRQP